MKTRFLGAMLLVFASLPLASHAAVVSYTSGSVDYNLTVGNNNITAGYLNGSSSLPFGVGVPPPDIYPYGSVYASGSYLSGPDARGFSAAINIYGSADSPNIFSDTYVSAHLSSYSLPLYQFTIDTPTSVLFTGNVSRNASGYYNDGYVFSFSLCQQGVGCSTPVSEYSVSGGANVNPNFSFGGLASNPMTLQSGTYFVSAGLVEDMTASGGGSASFSDTLNVSLAISPTTVPIPGAAWLFGSGVIGLAGLAKKRTRTA